MPHPIHPSHTPTRVGLRCAPLGLLFGLLLTLPATTRAAVAGEPAARPNVLFIAIDDLNDYVGVLGGHPQARTPHIDRLAARGMLFTNAHAPSPLCNPSRTAILTGFSPRRTGIYGNAADWKDLPLMQGQETLPQYFRHRGYWTGAAGKIYHAGHGYEKAALQGSGGGRQGRHDPTAWVERFPSHDIQMAIAPLLCRYEDNPLRFFDWDWRALDVPDDATEDGQAVVWAENKLRESFDQPFFLAVGLFRPHAPHYVPREYFEAFPLDEIVLPISRADDLDDIPLIALENEHVRSVDQRVRELNLEREAVRAYLASVLFVDAMVGRLLDALDASGHAPTTIVCLWSDHGWHLGEKNWWHKNTLWEEATRVPLIIAGAGVTAPGQSCARAVSLLDLYPTLVELCGLAANPANDGLSLVPQLRDPTHPRERPAIIHRVGDAVAVRSDDWRYIRYRDGSEELYDHRVDPHEWTNLAHRADLRNQKAALAQWLHPASE